MDQSNQLSLEECLPKLLEDKAIAALARKRISRGVEEILGSFPHPDSGEQEIIDGLCDELLDFLSDEATCLDTIEIECLSSYSATSEFSLMTYGGIFFIQNFEFGDTGYFTDAETAKTALESSTGIKWGDRDRPPSNSKVDDLEEFL